MQLKLKEVLLQNKLTFDKPIVLFRNCKIHYERDKDVNHYRTVKDEVVEMLTEEQHKSQFSTYSDCNRRLRESQSCK